MNKTPATTIYIQNRRDSNNFDGCNQLQVHRKLKVLNSANGCFSYTQPLQIIHPFVLVKLLLILAGWLSKSFIIGLIISEIETLFHYLTVLVFCILSDLRLVYRSDRNKFIFQPAYRIFYFYI